MIGKTLNRYRIIDRLGKGGMGEVWVAEDTRLGRRVALKVLPPEFAADRERLSRFEQEARTVAALNHPNIVTLHDIEEAEGQVYLVMELVTGPSLAELIPKGGLPEARLFDLAISLASAVAAANERGVVHRDLKPSNAMVTEQGVLKVLDFGLAKQQAAPGADISTELETATTPGAVLGTVPYMSPEQAQGKPADHRSDIFSLGVILYEMATGSRPFAGGSTAEVLSAILRDAPSSLVDLRPALPPRLARIIGRCLEKDPRQRFQSALDLKSELADLRQEISASDSTFTGVVAAAAPRPRLPWILAAGATAVLAAVALAVLLWPSSEEPPPPPVAAAEPEQQMIVVFPFENLGPPEDDYFAAGITDEITSRLSAVGSLGVISRTSAVQYDRTGKAMAQIGEDLGVSYVLEGTVRWAGRSGSSSRVRVTPQLVEVSRDAQVWSTSYEEQLDEIFAVQSDRGAARRDLRRAVRHRRKGRAGPGPDAS
jgi:TolB-like protein